MWRRLQQRFPRFALLSSARLPRGACLTAGRGRPGCSEIPPLPADNLRMLIDTVRDCMARALELDAPSTARVTAATTAGDVPGWTSVTHLALILELENAFRITFDNSEIASLGSVAAILERLSAKGVRPA